MEKVAAYEEMIWEDILEKEASTAYSRYFTGKYCGLKPKELASDPMYQTATRGSREFARPIKDSSVLGMPRTGHGEDSGYLNQIANKMELLRAQKKNNAMRRARLTRNK